MDFATLSLESKLEYLNLIYPGYFDPNQIEREILPLLNHLTDAELETYIKTSQLGQYIISWQGDILEQVDSLFEDPSLFERVAVVVKRYPSNCFNVRDEFSPEGHSTSDLSDSYSSDSLRSDSYSSESNDSYSSESSGSYSSDHSEPSDPSVSQSKKRQAPSHPVDWEEEVNANRRKFSVRGYSCTIM